MHVFTLLGKGKFFSEDNMKLVGSPCFANILLLLNIFSVHRDSKMFAKYGDPTSNIISSEKNLPLIPIRNLQQLKKSFTFFLLALALTLAPLCSNGMRFGISVCGEAPHSHNVWA